MDSDSTVSVPNVWFSDGNLIIQAETSRFRIYKGLLTQTSSFFGTLLSLPQPNDEELIEGCPTIVFQDTAHEAAYFLKAIYDSSFFEPPPTKTNMNIIASVLRLSTKYEVPHLRRRALRHLDTLYPLTLSAFDDRRETRTTPWTHNTAFFISTVARELNLLWLLPSVLYCITCLPFTDIANGFEWSGKRLHMDPVDRDACLQAIPILASMQHTDVLSFLTKTDVHNCQLPQRCTAVKLRTLGSLNSRRYIDPLDSFSTRMELKYSKEVCPACLNQFETLHPEGRMALWENLPSVFGLPPWNELKKMQAEALEGP